MIINSTLIVKKILSLRLSCFAKNFAGFFIITIFLWVIFFSVYYTLPLTRPGDKIVSTAKFTNLATGQMFARTDRVRLIVFGNSTTLAGFRPDIFEQRVGLSTRAYNMGLPGEAQFLPILKTILESGNRPTIIALTIPWDSISTQPSMLDRLRDDSAIVGILAPFRELPRNLTVFAAESHFHFLSEYRNAARQQDGIIKARGWYFIKSQSHYLNDSLPSDYSLPTDRPKTTIPRELPAQSLVRSALMSLAQQYKFKVLLIPDNIREGAAAAFPISQMSRFVTISSNPQISIVGPDYWVYPAPNFSDPVHLNPSGAIKYTQNLADLLKIFGILD